VATLGVKGLPTTDDGEYWLLQRARLIERLPDVFSTIWLFDHLQGEAEEGYDGWTALAWMAATFPDKRVGNMVLSQSFRNPGLLGVSAATLQQLTRGRVILGLGAGWLEEEYRSFNYEFPSPADRVGQLAEAIELIKTLWRDQPATFQGKWYSIRDAYCARPEPPVPIMVGTNGPRALKVVARLADWWCWDGPLDISYRRPMELLRAESEAIGRPFEEITKICELPISMPDDISGFEATYTHSNYPGQTFGVAGPQPAQVIREIEALVDVGVSHLALSFEDMPTFERFLADVVPNVRLEPRADGQPTVA
jgi:alkanesulfonate monooxygenase SsuD/methylene tetrahydromethanopterin reductase-like flavin-dependent oxidoreductase (luciferase family)